MMIRIWFIFGLKKKFLKTKQNCKECGFRVNVFSAELNLIFRNYIICVCKYFTSILRVATMMPDKMYTEEGYSSVIISAAVLYSEIVTNSFSEFT